jgi:hypothetical protein
MRVAVLGLGVAWGMLVAAGPAGAVPVTLQDGSALVSVDPDSQDGVAGWAVNGIAHLRTQWFWLRVGDAGPEISIDALDETARLASDTDADGQDDTLLVTLADPQQRFALDLRWTLTGSPFGPPTAGAASDLSLQLALTNTSGGPLDITLFQYTDVDLFNTFADDAAAWSGAGAPDTAIVTDSTGLATWQSLWSPAPGAVEASLYDATLASLNDAVATALSGALSATGDVTVSAAWRIFFLAAGGAVEIGQEQQIRVAPVPEPSASLLLAGGLGALAARRRTRAARHTPFPHPEATR